MIESYSFNGILETIFNMTQESDNTWLFRKPFDVTSKRVVCRSEKSAINDFMNFIEKLQSPVKLIGVDEETLSVVLNKCKQINLKKYEELKVENPWSQQYISFLEFNSLPL